MSDKVINEAPLALWDEDGFRGRMTAGNDRRARRMKTKGES